MITPPPSACRRVEVVHILGLHLRLAGQFVEMARVFAAKVRVRYNGAEADGKSVLDLMCLAAGFGAVLELEASGQDAEQAIETLADLLSPRSHGDGARSFPLNLECGIPTSGENGRGDAA